VIVLNALRKPAHRVRAAFCLMLLAVGARQARHFEMAGLLACVLLVPYVEDLFETWFPLGRTARPGVIAAAIVLPAVVAGATAFGVAYRTRAADEWVAEGTPLLDLIRALPDGARTYAPFQQAGLVLFYAAPRGVRVFYDSRNDCYSPETARTFLRRFTERPRPPHLALDRRAPRPARFGGSPRCRTCRGVWRRTCSGRWRLFIR
jgi:hypothetical protein